MTSAIMNFLFLFYMRLALQSCSCNLTKQAVERDSMAAQNQERTDVGADPDALGMAQEAVRAGILSQDVLDCLTSLNPKVLPNFMKLRYLMKHLHDLLKNAVFQVFLHTS